MRKNNIYSSIKLTTFEYFGKEKALLLWGIFIAIIFILLTIFISSLFVKVDFKSTSSSGPVKIISPQARLIAPSITDGTSSIRVYRQDLFSKSADKNIFDLKVGDVFRLELEARDFDQRVTIPKYGIIKELPKNIAGVLEFQVNIAGKFNVFCNSDDKPCAFIEVKK